MKISFHLIKIFILVISVGMVFPFMVQAKKPPLVKTSWSRSNGMQVDGDIYFLSRYSLYQPGKVIIPMFIVTKTKRFFLDLSLYRLSSSGGRSDSAGLQRLWSLGDNRNSGVSAGGSNMKSCRFGREGVKLYFSRTGGWVSDEKKSRHPILEYDIRSGRSRLLVEEGSVETAAATLEYRPPEYVKASDTWVVGGLLPLDVWGLPSPLEYSSRDKKFLRKVLVEKMGDREFRRAALESLDSRGDVDLMEDLLQRMEALRDKRSEEVYDKSSYGEYYEKWSILIEMGETLRGAGKGEDRAEVFAAVFDNDAAELRRLIESGADPNSTDEEGRNLLMYAIFGGAPDSLRLLFEKGADPDIESNTGYTAWMYAALSPLRNLYLELWGK